MSSVGFVVIMVAGRLVVGVGTVLLQMVCTSAGKTRSLWSEAVSSVIVSVVTVTLVLIVVSRLIMLPFSLI